ncbi:MAG: hypothetical protein K0R83_1815, partial [Caulobacter sp.]|nr:hypothetical protein [Caulobacter sp.]
MLVINPRLDTDLVRAPLGLAAGTVTAVASHLLLVAAQISLTTGQSLGAVIDGLFVLFVVAILFWSAGIFTLGLLGWWVLHQIGARGPAAAALLGAALPGGLVGMMVWSPVVWGSFAAS